MTWKRKQANWQIVTAALVINEEHMSDCHTRFKLVSNKVWAKNQSNDTKGKNLPNDWSERDAPLQSFGAEQHSLKENDGVVNTKWWSVGMIEEHGLHMVLLKVVQELVVVPQIQYIAVFDATTKSLNLECSETVEDDLQNAVNRQSGQCPYRDACFPPFQKNLMESTRESCEEPDCMCSEKCVVWTSIWA